MIFILAATIGGCFAIYCIWRFAQDDKSGLDGVTRILIEWNANNIHYGLAMQGYFKEGVPFYFRAQNQTLINIDIYPMKNTADWEIEVYTQQNNTLEESRVYIPVPRDVKERVRTVIHKIQKKYGLLDG